MEMEMEPSSAETSTAVEDDLSDLFGDQEVFPRVGDEYQAEILEGIQQSKAETSPIEFFVGLPVTVMRVEKDKPSSTEGETGRNGFCIVPGSKQGDWSETEEAELVLGLYIFGKDFVKLKAFLGCKTMGSIMAFYYGKFYKSHGYRRWSDCKKSKSRKVALGQKIFAGFRLQELLSRLSLHASEERQNALSKVSDLYEEGNMRLDEFVLTIKAIVGMNNFVEAMSIGKGKQDITTLVSPKTNHSTVRKSCSSLTPSEIIKLLTGDVRLSKARSNDLFWEAVWPRLLARGWHSEQPKCYAAVSKQSLVFLLPGFAKFSRRSLIKGDHYFDSITDILNKVATEPTLLELVVDESSESKKKLEPDNSSDCQLQSYLQPQTSYRNSDLLKFTIADTSLTTIEGKPYSTRKLRVLPDESIVISASTHNSREDSSTSTDDDLNHCSNSASVAINKHKRKRVSQKEVQQSTSTDDDTNDRSNGTSVATNKHKRKRVSQKEVQQSISTDDDTNDCSNGTSVATNKHQRKRVSQKEEQPPISTNGNLVEAKKDSGFGFSMDQSNHESIPRGLIDLNYPPLPLPPGFDSCDMFMMDIQKEISAQPVPPVGEQEQEHEQASNVNGRRHSTRSRPPTAKALEALADGLWTGAVKRDRNRTGRCRENSRSRTNS